MPRDDKFNFDDFPDLSKLRSKLPNFDEFALPKDFDSKPEAYQRSWLQQRIAELEESIATLKVEKQKLHEEIQRDNARLEAENAKMEARISRKWAAIKSGKRYEPDPGETGAIGGIGDLFKFFGQATQSLGTGSTLSIKERQLREYKARLAALGPAKISEAAPQVPLSERVLAELKKNRAERDSVLAGITDPEMRARVENIYAEKDEKILQKLK